MATCSIFETYSISFGKATRKRFSVVLSCLFTFLSTIYSSAALADGTVRISSSTGTSATLIWVAEEIDAFERNNVDVELVPFDAGWQSIKAMREGKVDLAAATDFAYVKMGMSDPELMIVSQLCRDQDNGIVANKVNGVFGPKSLAGKRIGVTVGSSSEFFLAQTLLNEGLTLDDVSVVPLPPNKMPNSLLNNEVDAISTWEPWSYKANEKMGGDSFYFPVNPGQETIFLLLGEKPWLSDNHAAVEKVLHALEDAALFLQKPEATATVVNLYKDRFASNNEFVKYMYAKQINSLGLPQALLNHMETQAEWLVRDNANQTIPNYLERIYFNGLEEVKPESITIFR